MGFHKGKNGQRIRYGKDTLWSHSFVVTEGREKFWQREFSVGIPQWIIDAEGEIDYALIRLQKRFGGRNIREVVMV